MTRTISKLGFICLVLSAVAQAAPKWTQDPIELAPAKEGMAYSFNLAPFAVSESGSPLTFKKTAGAAFLSLSASGVLTGTPSKADVGQNTFRVSVSDGEAGAIATVNLTVLKTPEPPVWPLTCESGEKAFYVGKTNNGDIIYSCSSH